MKDVKECEIKFNVEKHAKVYALHTFKRNNKSVKSFNLISFEL